MARSLYDLPACARDGIVGGHSADPNRLEPKTSEAVTGPHYDGFRLSADAQTFIPSGSALVRSEHDRSCISHDPVAEDMRSGASRTSQLHQGPSPEILTAGSIHLIVNDMVRRAAILDGHSHEMIQFILDNIQRFWAFRLEDELDAIRSTGYCTSSHSHESSSTASSASTEASFHTAVSYPVDSDLDLLGSDKSGNGETASMGTHACDANDAA